MPRCQLCKTNYYLLVLYHPLTILVGFHKLESSVLVDDVDHIAWICWVGQQGNSGPAVVNQPFIETPVEGGQVLPSQVHLIAKPSVP